MQADEGDPPPEPLGDRADIELFREAQGETQLAVEARRRLHHPSERDGVRSALGRFDPDAIHEAQHRGQKEASPVREGKGVRIKDA